MSAFLIDVEGPDHEPVVRDSLNKMELLKSQIGNSQTLVGMAEEEVRRNIERLRDSLFLSKQSHVADLIWVVGELKAILASWIDAKTPVDQPLNFDISISDVQVAVARERVQHLATALTEKIKDDA